MYRWTYIPAFQRILFLGALSSPLLSFGAGFAPKGTLDPNPFNVSWHPVHYSKLFVQLPLEGSVENEHIPWSDSYWPIQMGGMGFRWKQFQDPDFVIPGSSQERKREFFDVHRYSKTELLNIPLEERNRVVAELSPLEKYSLYKGDYSYSLVDHFQKQNDAAVSYWQGYCHAWAPVSLHYPEPVPVVRTNADGIEIPFGSADVKAVMIASYADRVKFTAENFFGSLGRRLGNLIKKIGGVPITDKNAAFIGQRCTKRFIYPSTKMIAGKEVFSEYGDTSGMTTADYIRWLQEFQKKAIELNYHPDGGPDPRSSDFIDQVVQNMNDPACSDVNAGAFHIVISNQLGLLKEGFLFDKNRDIEVWNQPAFRYQAKVVEWMKPDGTRSPETVSVVHLNTRIYFADDTDYGWAYWFPTLLSLFHPNSDFLSEYDRYQKLLLRQGDLTVPGKYPEGIIDFADYDYTLDLNAAGEIIGGDWISFDRPDFLWLFKKEPFTGDYEKLNEIYEPVQLPDGPISIGG